MSPCKLLIIGHDGLDFNLIKRDICPPDLASLITKLAIKGTFTRMKSEYMSTAPSWMSIYTGLKQEDHRSGGSWQGWIKRKYTMPTCYWNRFNERGYTTGVFSMPLTYPPREVDGWMVSGFPTPFNNIGLTYPESLDKFMDGYISDIIQPVMVSRGLEKPVGFSMKDVGEFKKLGPNKIIRETIDAKISTLQKIFAEHPVDIVSVGFCFLDHAMHLHCSVEQAYSMVDYSISESLRITDPEKVVIVSDHGKNITETGTFLIVVRKREGDPGGGGVLEVFWGCLKWGKIT